jgi:hypothetical protein
MCFLLYRFRIVLMHYIVTIALKEAKTYRWAKMPQGPRKKIHKVDF